MSFPFRAIGFDWAYTLVDLVREDDRKPLQKVFSLLNSKSIPLPDFEECLDRSRKIFFPMIEEAHVTNQEAHFEVVLQQLMDDFGILLNREITLKELLEVYYLEVYSGRRGYPEVMRVLSRLKEMGVLMGVVSNTTNPQFMKEREMKILGLQSYFDFAIYSSSTPFRKPHPSIFELAIDNFKIEPQEILFVGDNFSLDVVGAKKVGMKSAWVNRECKTISKDIESDYELSSLDDLLCIGTPVV